jgi:hypothetical protein
MDINGYNPQHRIFPYSSYNDATNGLKIEMLYRKVGEHIWYKAYDDKSKPLVLLSINSATPASVSE